MGQMGFLELQHSVHTGAPCTTSNSPTSLGLIPDSRGVPARPLPQMLGTSHNTPEVSRHPTHSQTPNAHSTQPHAHGKPVLQTPHPAWDPSARTKPHSPARNHTSQLSNTNILCAFGSEHSSAGFPRPGAACVSPSPGCMPSPPDK